MNFPNGVVGHVLSTVALIFRSMAYIPIRLADHRNGRRLTEGQLLGSASVKRKPCWSPTKNGCANLTPLRFCRYFTDNDLSPVASCSAICNGTADNRPRAEYEHNPGHSFGSRNHYVSLTFVEGG